MGFRSRPDKNSFGKKWFSFSLIFVAVFCGFILATTVLIYQRNHEFKNFSNFLYDFGQNQVATVQSITYLRQINIKLFTEDIPKIPLIPLIIDEVDRLDRIIFDKVLKLSPYLADIVWSCIDILPYGQRIVRKEKAFIVLNNFIINPITNLINNLRE